MKKLILSLGIILPFLSFGQVFSAGFETNTGPLSAWTLYNVDMKTPATQVNYVNAAWVQRLEEPDNNVATSTSYYTPAGAANDWMVSPAITLPAGTNTLYWHAKASDPLYPDGYRVLISTTGNAVANFTTTLLTVPAEATTWQNKSINLSSYAGQTVYIAFQNNSNDQFLLSIDNVHVLNGTSPQPGRLITRSNVTKTSATINWPAASTGVTGYDYFVGLPSATPSITGSTTTATTAAATGLLENTKYHYYVRSKNGTTNGMWIGPNVIYTATELGIGSYAYGFDNTTAGFYTNDGWTGSWSTNATAGNPQAGPQMVFSNSSGVLLTPTNNSLYSKPFNLSAGNVYNVSFFIKNFGTAPIPPQSLKLTVGNESSAAAQTNTLYTTSTFAATTWTQVTSSFTPTTSGTYYFGINHFTPGNAATVSLGLDTFAITGVLGVNDIMKNDSNIIIYPNPVSDILNIKSKDKVKNVEIYDMTGRKINVELNDNAINVKELQSGSYILSVETSKGKFTEKFIKK